MKAPVKPVVLCILDGVGEGDKGPGDAVFLAHTPNLDRLRADYPSMLLKAHGTAVGLPSDKDMGNSEVGHNALGAGRVFDQGAKLVDNALESGAIFGETWSWLKQSGTLHLLGLVSDGNVHSHLDHLLALVARARTEGVQRLRVHVLTDGRDVGERSAPGFIAALETALEGDEDYAIASGGGRMNLTMDRYEADWSMVDRGWQCHVHGQGRAFSSAGEAIRTFYSEDAELTDQYLPAFVIEGVDGGIRDGDGVLLFNFRGDRALEISRAFEGREVGFDIGPRPQVRYAGLMQYDGDESIPYRYLVEPPAIDGTVGQVLAEAGLGTFAISETQKYGHVTFFFNGNRSGFIDEALERYQEVTSDVIPFDQAPAMKANEVTDAVVAAIEQGGVSHIRLNLANGDMVGHTGDIEATKTALTVVDACVGRLAAAVVEHGGILLVTADHGNADDMLQKDGSPKTSHSLNPVPFVLVDPSGSWRLASTDAPGLANVAATVLVLCGAEPPANYLPALVEKA
jgi:2,3-bisphosphoglycerate-independent phosphoglycerate mutase